MRRCSTEMEVVPDRLKLPLQFDPLKLRDDLARLQSTEWTDHFVKQNYEGSWSVIPLRAPAGEEHVIRMIYPDPSCREFVDTAFLQECPYFQDVLAAIPAPVGAVRLMRLEAGSIIKEHRDHDLAYEFGAMRLHIPVVTNPDVEFLLNGERVMMNPGECWYLRLSDPHAVANRGNTDRVHMVIDMEVNEWVSNIINRKSAGIPSASVRQDPR